MFAIELILPFFIVGPRRLRHIACGGIAGLMVLIGLTGNYTYFNLLTVVIALTLVEDQSWPRWLQRRQGPSSKPSLSLPGVVRFLWPVFATTGFVLSLGLTILVVTIADFHLQSTVYQARLAAHHQRHWQAPSAPPDPTAWQQFCLRAAAPYRSINSYGLFANMTETRREITIEGSIDGQTWQPYRFRNKPGALDERPRFVQPHQPRVDWQMWFAALGDLRQHPWLIQMMQRLLEGSEPVMGLLGYNPFPDAPPRYVRAVIATYTFTDRDELRDSGNWWRRENPRAYSPVLMLQDGELRIRPSR